jgi:hypothetical protein
VNSRIVLGFVAKRTFATHRLKTTHLMISLWAILSHEHGQITNNLHSEKNTVAIGGTPKDY